MGRVLSSVTDILGTFVQEVGNMGFTPQDVPEPSVRRSKRCRTAPSPPTDDFLDEEGDSEYEEESEEEEEFDSDSESDDEDLEACHSDDIAQASTPVDESGDNEGAHRDEVSNLPNDSVEKQEEEDDEDDVPLIRRLSKIRGAADQVSTIVPLQIQPPTHKCNLGGRRARLRLPDAPPAGNVSSSAATLNNSGQGGSLTRTKSADESLLEKHSPPLIARSNSLDFTPPECNIMKFIDEQESPENVGHSKNEEKGKQLDQTWQTEPRSTFSLDGYDEEFWSKLELEAIKKLEMSKNNPQVISDAPISLCDTSLADISVTPQEPSRASSSAANPSASPAYQPAPRRRLNKAAALQSPYIDFTSKRSFKCSKDVCAAYNAVLTSIGRPTRSRSTPNTE